MECNSKSSLVIGILASVVAITGLIVALRSPSSVQVNMGAQSATVSPSGVPSVQGDLVGANVGEISNFTSVQTSDDLIVGDQISVAGTSTFSGNIAGNVPGRSVITMSTATTTPCAVQNTTGSDRVLSAISGLWTAYAGAGTVGLTVGTSSSAFVTSTSPFISNVAFANSASLSVVATTSSLMTAYAPWKSGEWLVWKTVTSTNAGTCSAISF